MQIKPEQVVGVILAGGLARRMGGGDKSMLKLGGRRILDYVIESAQNQLHTVIINANGDPKRFAEFNLPVQADIVPDFAGPLAGVVSAMAWVKQNNSEATHIITLAADTPFFPHDYVARMLELMALKQQRLACASYQGRTQPVFGLWPVDLFDDLYIALVEDDVRKVDRFTAPYGVADVAFDELADNPFFNVNKPEDLDIGEQQLANRPV
ncbi:MAG TPA: molybdenum cofactor guanylyltransferase MobA [Oceanospirillaceae bacterium]|nr:molybdenum cofactor guanylyltransferase MobA [Oceanospirillaceae bacterium]